MSDIRPFLAKFGERPKTPMRPRTVGFLVTIQLPAGVRQEDAGDFVVDALQAKMMLIQASETAQLPEKVQWVQHVPLPDLKVVPMKISS